MALQGLAQCYRIFFIVLLMCPKQTRLSAPIGKQQEYFHAVRRSQNEVFNPAPKSLQGNWWTLRGSNSDKQTEDGSLTDEPGFDLDNEEIIKFKLWPKGIIPYYIDTLSFNDKVLRDRIRAFLNVVNSLTSISFQEMPSPPKDNKTRWVFFVNRRGQLGCADHSIQNFTNEGVQLVVLGYDCMSTGGELAEAVLAIAGVPPQHNAPYRDSFITVHAENIIPEKRYLFQKLNIDEWLFYDLKYDFSSASHFHYHKHSVNGHATIEVQPIFSDVSIGETHGLTYSDIKKIKMLYNYIVRKRENKAPECEKLFRPGIDFSKRLRKQSEPPRKKPNQYLGLPEEQHNGQDKRHNDKNNTIEGIHEHNVPYENYENVNSGADNDNGDEVNTERPVASKNKLNLKSYPNTKRKQRTAKKRPDPLTYLSDYVTGEDRRREKIKKIE